MHFNKTGCSAVALASWFLGFESKFKLLFEFECADSEINRTILRIMGEEIETVEDPFQC